VHHPHGHVAAPSPDEPRLTGERARHGHEVDELTPTLVDLVKRCDGLHRLVSIAAQSAGRGGIAADERAVLRGFATEYAAAAVESYPAGGHAAARPWMLAAAVEALLDEQGEAAAYHVAWLLALDGHR
jgi:hypothetical protein